MNRFPRVLGVRPGYDPDEVDSLIRRIEGTLGRGTLDSDPITADEIRNARFRLRLGGYNEMAVDFALEAFIVAVETKGMTSARPPRSGPEAGGGAQARGDREADRAWPDRMPPSGETHPATDDPATEAPDPRPAVSAQETIDVSGRPRSAGRYQSGQIHFRRPSSRRSTQDQPQPPPDHPTSVVEASGEGVPVVSEVNGKGSVVAEVVPAGPVDVVAKGGGVVEREAFSADWFETQAARVERVGFRAGRLGMGYNEDEVDAFLDRIVATLRGTTDRPVTPGDVRAATFSTVLFKPGYAIGEVDEFLAELADVIAHLRPAG